MGDGTRQRQPKRLHWAWGACAWALAAGCGAAEPGWVTLPNGSLEIAAGSALDFSELPLVRFKDGAPRVQVQGRAFVRSDLGPQPQRFFCATFAASPNNGGMPSHADADRLAQQLRRAGYNAVRVHMVEAQLMAGRRADFDFDPEQLDRLDYLLAALRKQGLYLVVDMLGSWNGAYGDVRGHRWVRGQHDVVLGSLLPGAERAHWLELVKRLWARPNRYTGTSALKDPATLAVMLVNEGDADYLLRNGPARPLDEPFRAWLAAKGPEAATLLAAGDSQPHIKAKTRQAEQFQQFTVALQDEQAAWMRQQLQALGFSGPVTAYNTGLSYHASRARQAVDFVDMHQYADHPADGMVEPGARMQGGRLLDGKNRYLDRLAWSRQWAQPFTVTEYGQPFWNRWRWEVAPFTAAYARLQGWSLITHYGDTLNLARPGNGRWRQMMVPFDVGTDPTLRAGETVAALLFGRGDVAPSTASADLVLDPKAAAAMPGDRFVSWYTAQLQYVMGVGLSWQGQPGATGARMPLALADDDERAAGLLQRAKARGVLPADHPVGGVQGPFVSSTRQLVLEPAQQRMTVATPATLGVMGSAGSVARAGGATVQVLDGEGAVFLSALDAPDLARAQRLLLVVSTEARNTGMRFRDGAETVLEQVGTLPVQLRDAQVQVTVPAAPSGKAWVLYALDETGRRQQTLPLKAMAQGAQQATVRLAEVRGPVSPYFEWVAQ
ncbi:hypothetical protein [Roseateles sp. BYS87W]|uniref:Cellulase (Glycosyl hydrolase family 5) n=1 Tax=Pelomonas baiyunensis TaxID=3299026 RepID=A0ABW7H3M0_9BURK